MAATSRLDVRVRPDVKARMERAAALEQVPVSEFVRSAAEDRAERVLREHETRTVVPAEFLDDLLAALDAPGKPDAALSRAARRARKLITG
jgi:uncharacterized protein (DUF1778 family)